MFTKKCEGEKVLKVDNFLSFQNAQKNSFKQV